MKTVIGADAAKLAGLQVDLLQRIRNKKITLEDLEWFNGLSPKKLAEMRGVKMEEKFRISDVFGHRNPSMVPQYHGDNFKAWFLTPNQNRTITVPSGMQKPKEYVLPQNMTDTEMQNANQATPMDEDTFWAVLYLLIIKPELGKELLEYELSKSNVYIFHVKMADGTVRAVSVRWGGDEWYCRAWTFDRGYVWGQGGVFVRFATV